jgi:hypothetical protein
MVPSSACLQQQILREQYLSALRAYRQMIPALDAVSTSRGFDEAFERAELVRLLFVAARNDLNNHVKKHSCG